MFGTRGASTLKSIILDHLRRLGATRMEASYDGGNDEGGVNDVRVLRPVTEENPAWVIYALRPNGFDARGVRSGVRDQNIHLIHRGDHRKISS